MIYTKVIKALRYNLLQFQHAASSVIMLMFYSHHHAWDISMLHFASKNVQKKDERRVAKKHENILSKLLVFSIFNYGMYVC